MKKEKNELEDWRKNAEEDYMRTPISVLRYISELEHGISYQKRRETYFEFASEYTEMYGDGAEIFPEEVEEILKKYRP